MSIKNNNLFLRANKVINSCETHDQLIVAMKYVSLCIKKHYKEMKNNFKMHEFDDILLYNLKLSYNELIDKKFYNLK